MCVGGTPDVPKTPERQMAKAPNDPVRDRTKADEARRRGMLATILTSAAGAGSLTPSSGAGGGAGQKQYLG